MGNQARPYKRAMEHQQVIAVLETEAAPSHDDFGLSLFDGIRNTGALDWNHRPDKTIE